MRSDLWNAPSNVRLHIRNQPWDSVDGVSSGDTVTIMDRHNDSIVVKTSHDYKCVYRQYAMGCVVEYD